MRDGRNEAKKPVVTCRSHDTSSSQGRWSNGQLRGGRQARGSSIATRLNRGESGAACGSMPSAPRGAVEYTRMKIEVDGTVTGVRSRQIWRDPIEECPLPPLHATCFDTLVASRYNHRSLCTRKGAFHGKTPHQGTDRRAAR